MSSQSVSAPRALDWFMQGSRALMGNPAMFLGMSLVVIVLQFVPLVNMIASLALPIFQAGILYALHEQREGREVRFEHLFAGFTTEGKLLPLIFLCIPSIVAGILIVVLLFVFFGSAIMGLIAGSEGGGQISTGSSVFAGTSAIIGIFAVLAVAVVLGAALMFAVPRVMLDNLEPIAAMKESINACLKNIPALLMLMLLGVGVLIFCLIPIVGWLLGFALMLIGVCWSTSIQHEAYLDVFAGSTLDDQVVFDPPPAPLG